MHPLNWCASAGRVHRRMEAIERLQGMWWVNVMLFEWWLLKCGWCV